VKRSFLLKIRPQIEGIATRDAAPIEFVGIENQTSNRRDCDNLSSSLSLQQIN